MLLGDYALGREERGPDSRLPRASVCQLHQRRHRGRADLRAQTLRRLFRGGGPRPVASQRAHRNANPRRDARAQTERQSPRQTDRHGPRQHQQNPERQDRADRQRAQQTAGRAGHVAGPDRALPPRDGRRGRPRFGSRV